MKTIDHNSGFSRKKRNRHKKAKVHMLPLKPLENQREENEGRRTGGITARGITVSFLVEETLAMERMQRLAEQEGHRRFGAKVHQREHHTEQQQNPGQEGDLQNSIAQHPLLDGQRFDGVDVNLNPEPPLNTEARREFDNERREQEMEKQLRLGNMPKFGSSPTPKPG